MVSLGGLMPFFLFPRVKSEAIVARREPKEEVEDVSSYLCTELVYYITKMPVGKGGLCTYSVLLQVCQSRDVCWSAFINSDRRLLLMSIANKQMPWDYLFLQLQTIVQLRWAAGRTAIHTMHDVASAERCWSSALLSTFLFYLVLPDFELKCHVQCGFSRGLVIARLLQKTLSPQWQWSCKPSGRCTLKSRLYHRQLCRSNCRLLLVL